MIPFLVSRQKAGITVEAALIIGFLILTIGTFLNLSFTLYHRVEKVTEEEVSFLVDPVDVLYMKSIIEKGGASENSISEESE